MIFPIGKKLKYSLKWSSTFLREYVRKSAGNALRDISKKFPALIKEELSTWDISDKKTAQFYKLAYRYIAEKSMDSGTGRV